MVTPSRAFLLQQPPQPPAQCGNGDDEQQPVIAQEIAGGDEAAGESRQFGRRVLEDVDDARHDRRQHEADDAQRHDDQRGRVDHGVGNALAQFLARFRVVGEPFQHDVQVAGLLARGHRRAVQLRKGLREIAETVCERVTLHDLGADAEQYALGARMIVLLRDGQQDFLERQPRLRQRRHLPRDEREFAGRQAAPQRKRRLAFRFALRHLGDAHGIHVAFAQQLPDVLRRVALDQALGFLAGLVQRDEFVGTHSERPG